MYKTLLLGAFVFIGLLVGASTANAQNIAINNNDVIALEGTTTPLYRVNTATYTATLITSWSGEVKYVPQGIFSVFVPSSTSSSTPTTSTPSTSTRSTTSTPTPTPSTQAVPARCCKTGDVIALEGTTSPTYRVDITTDTKELITGWTGNVHYIPAKVFNFFKVKDQYEQEKTIQTQQATIKTLEAKLECVKTATAQDDGLWWRGLLVYESYQRSINTLFIRALDNLHNRFLKIRGCLNT